MCDVCISWIVSSSDKNSNLHLNFLQNMRSLNNVDSLPFSEFKFAIRDPISTAI